MTWTPNSGAAATASNAGTGTSQGVTLAGAVAVGDTIDLAVSYGTSIDNPTSASLTDSLGNVYTKKSGALDGTNFQACETHQCIVTVAGTPTITVKMNPTPGTTRFDNCIVNADPFTGSDASSASDGTGAAQKQATPTTTTDLLTSGTFTTATDGDNVYTGTIDSATGGNPGSVGTGFTLLQSGGVGIVNLKTAYKVQSAHGSVAGTWTAAVNDAHVTAAHATTPAASSLAIDEGVYLPPVFLPRGPTVQVFS
jgi:hypothetical protein